MFPQDTEPESSVIPMDLHVSYPEQTPLSVSNADVTQSATTGTEVPT